MAALFIMLVWRLTEFIEESLPLEGAWLVFRWVWMASILGTLTVAGYGWDCRDRRERQAVWWSFSATIPGVLFSIEFAARTVWADRLGLDRVQPYDLTTILLALLGMFTGPALLATGFRKVALREASRPLVVARVAHGFAWLASSWAALSSALAV